MSNFTNSAKMSTTMSDLMVNREKTTTEELMKQYPDGVTVTEFDIIHMDGSQFPVCVIKENSDVFFFGGRVISNIISDWVTMYDNSVKATSEALKDAGGVKMKFSSGKTKKGNSITLVDIVG